LPAVVDSSLPAKTWTRQLFIRGRC
jgi:hypothetical protein